MRKGIGIKGTDGEVTWDTKRGPLFLRIGGKSVRWIQSMDKPPVRETESYLQESIYRVLEAINTI